MCLTIRINTFQKPVTPTTTGYFRAQA